MTRKPAILLGKGVPPSAPIRLLLSGLVVHGLLRSAAAAAGVGFGHFGVGGELHRLLGTFNGPTLLGSQCLAALGLVPGGVGLGRRLLPRRWLLLSSPLTLGRGRGRGRGQRRGDEVPLDEPSLDADAAVGQILATTVADLLLPVPPSTLGLEPRDDGGPLGRGVDPDPAVLVVHLFYCMGERGRMSGLSEGEIRARLDMR